MSNAPLISPGATVTMATLWDAGWWCRVVAMASNLLYPSHVSLIPHKQPAHASETQAVNFQGTVEYFWNPGQLICYKIWKAAYRIESSEATEENNVAFTLALTHVTQTIFHSLDLDCWCSISIEDINNLRFSLCIHEWMYTEHITHPTVSSVLAQYWN